MPKNLFLFSFSPVQGFISTARKPRDLFTASYIISFLTEKVIKELGLEDRVIYPVVKNQGELKLANYPNKFIAEVDEDLCEKVKEKFKEIWKRICEDVWNGLNLNLKNKDEVEKQFFTQTENYFNVFCKCIKYTNFEEWKRILELNNLEELSQNDDYAFTYDLAERLLGAQKSWRPYKNIVDNSHFIIKKENGEEKIIYPDGCSMCGERVHLAFDWKKKSLEKIFNEKDLNQIRRGEKLCGVCLVKRFAVIYSKDLTAQDYKNFPSTEEIAGIKFKENLKAIIEKNKKLKEKLHNLYEALKQSPYIIKRGLLNLDDNALQIDSEIFRKEAWESLFEDEMLKNLKNQIEEIWKELKKEGIEHKNPYFALLISDGDGIGDWLGIKSDIRKEKLTREFHKKFSKTLSDYATDVSTYKNITDQIVYAGGDDLMALLHPSDAVMFAKECAKKFTEKLKSLAKEGKKPSVSAGILVAHAKDNLKKILEETKNLENKAKNNVEGKGAVCIGVRTRTGSLTYFLSKWEDLRTFCKFVEAFKSDQLGSTFAYEFREYESVLEDERIFKSLLRRSLKRKVQKGSWEVLFKTSEEFIEKTKKYLKNEDPIRNYINMVYVARFLSREEV